jgi:hypothetical protein
MAPGTDSLLRRWREAGLIDAATAGAIERWEAERNPPARLGAPIRVALALGAVLLAAGLLLFVSAHWDRLSPGHRFALLLALVVGLHGLAAGLARHFAVLSVALHGVGTVALGGGIFLAGQIFHLEARWPAGLLLWAVGAALGWILLGQGPQLALLVLLLPAWLSGEWLSACGRLLQNLPGAWPAAQTVLAAGLLLLSLALFGAAGPGAVGADRRVLVGIGGVALLPAAVAWGVLATAMDFDPTGLPLPLALIGWGVALAGPLLLGWLLRRRAFWPLGVALGWMLVDLAVRDDGGVTALSHGWWLLGGVLLVAWGVTEARPERINLGAALSALSVLAFYFSEVMGSLGRSASLIGLGILFLAGGAALERLRRRLVRATRGPSTP